MAAAAPRERPDARKEYLILIHDGSKPGRKRLFRELSGAQPILANTIKRTVKAFDASKARLLVYMQARDMPVGKTFHVESVEELVRDLFPRISTQEMVEGDVAHFLLAAAPALEQEITRALQASGEAR